MQDDEAHVFVGVTMQQVLQSSDRRGSLLVRRSIIAANVPDDAETSSSSGAWQPQDSILEIEPSTSSAPGMPAIECISEQTSYQVFHPAERRQAVQNVCLGSYGSVNWAQALQTAC